MIGESEGADGASQRKRSDDAHRNADSRRTQQAFERFETSLLAYDHMQDKDRQGRANRIDNNAFPAENLPNWPGWPGLTQKRDNNSRA